MNVNLISSPSVLPQTLNYPSLQHPPRSTSITYPIGSATDRLCLVKYCRRPLLRSAFSFFLSSVEIGCSIADTLYEQVQCLKLQYREMPSDWSFTANTSHSLDILLHYSGHLSNPLSTSLPFHLSRSVTDTLNCQSLMLCPTLHMARSLA